VSTMLDVDPSLQVAVFLSAEDDFVFMQPSAVGLAHVGDSPETLQDQQRRRVALRNKRKISKMESQCKLPQVSQVFETRATLQADSCTHPTLLEVEDFFKMWGRAIPYDVVDDDTSEPFPNYSVGTCPCWWDFRDPDSAAWTANVNNSWYMTNDYLSLFSAHFLYYRGSIGHKVVCTDNTDALYKYVSLGNQFPGMKQPCHTPFTYSADAIPYDANLGYGVTITPVDKQPVLDLTIPFRSPLVWRPVFWDYDSVDDAAASAWGLTTAPQVVHNIELWDADTGDLNDALFRKGGEDYSVAVEGCLPPPYLWVARGFDWAP